MVYIQNNLNNKYTIFLKIYRIVTAKVLLTLKKCHSSEMYRKSSVKLHSSIKQKAYCITVPFQTKYAILLYKEQWSGYGG